MSSTRVSPEQRHVAGDEHGAAEPGRQRVQAALDGAAGALDVVLVGDDEARVEGGAHLDDAVALVADDDLHVVGTRGAGRADGVADEREATDVVQDLGVADSSACPLRRRGR